MSTPGGGQRKRRKWRAAKVAAVFLLVGIAVSTVLLVGASPPKGVQLPAIKGSAIVDLDMVSVDDETEKPGGMTGGTFRGVIVAPGRLLTVFHGITRSSKIVAYINGEERLVTGLALADSGRDVAVLSYTPRPDDPAPMALAEPGAEPPREVILASFSQRATLRLQVECTDFVPELGRMLVLDHEVEAGMSGSPVVSDDGVVWGVIRAGWEKRTWASCVSEADLAARMNDDLRRMNHVDGLASAEEDWSYFAMEDGDEAAAVKHARRAMEISGGRFFPVIALIDAYMVASENDKAAALLKGLVDEASDSLCLSWLIADRLIQCERWEEALPVARWAAELSGGKVDDQILVARCLRETGRYRELVDVMDSTLARPGSEAATNLLAAALYNTEQLDRCIALGSDGSVVGGLAAFYIGRSHMDREEYGEAEGWLRRAVGARSDDHVIWDALAFTLARLKSSEAEEAARRALELDAGSAEQVFRLGRTQLELGRDREAKETLEDAALAFGKDVPAHVTALLGEACFRCRAYREGRAWYLKSGPAYAQEYAAALTWEWVSRCEEGLRRGRRVIGG